MRHERILWPLKGNPRRRPTRRCWKRKALKLMEGLVGKRKQRWGKRGKREKKKATQLRPWFQILDVKQNNTKQQKTNQKNNHFKLPIPRKFTNLARSNYRIPSYPPKAKSKSTGLGWKRRGKNRLRSPKLARVTQYSGGLRRAATPRAPAPAVMTAARAQLLWFTAYERGNNTARVLPFALWWPAKGSVHNIKMGLRYCFCWRWSRLGSNFFLFPNIVSIRKVIPNFWNVNFNPQNIYWTKEYG